MNELSCSKILVCQKRKRNDSFDRFIENNLINQMISLIFSVLFLHVPREENVKVNGEQMDSKFPQIADHKDGSQTFNQRFSQYIVDGVKWKPGDPIFLYISGESDSFDRGTGTILEKYALDLNAIILSLEHRYFGESYVIANDTSYETLSKYLTVDQAIEDLETFAQWWRAANDTEHKSKWIIAGGSYSGMLSAFVIRKYNTFSQHDDNLVLFSAAISSSGVVLASNDLKEFDLQDGISMGPECSSLARHTWHELEPLVEDDETYPFIAEKFGMPNLPREDFYFVVGELFTIALQYGKLSVFCDPLEKAYFSNGDVISALAEFSRTFFKDNVNNSGPRCWLFITCNELGYWQTPNDRLGVRPQQTNKSYYQKQCHDVFGDKIEDLTDEKINNFNEKYGGLNQPTNHTFYTTGCQDPWTWASMTKESLDLVQVTSQIPVNSFARTVIGDEMGHCPDLKPWKESNPTNLKKVHLEIERALAKWLKEEN